jgi:hypothetical protein
MSGQGGSKPGGKYAVNKAVATAPVAESANPQDGVDVPSSRAKREL